MADGADDGGIEAGGSPGDFRGIEQVVDCGVPAVRPVMAPQVMPKILDRIQFRRVRRQSHERDVRRADQVVRPMKSRAVPHQDRLHIRFQRRRQLGEEQVHDRSIEPRRDQSFGLTGLGARGRQDIDETVLRLSDCARPRSGASPDTRQCPLLSEPCFVFVEDLQPAVGVLRLNFVHPLAELFLNSSCAAGSAWGCCGRGTSDE